MANFVRGYNDTGKSASVFYDGHAVDFLETFIHYARSADVSKPWINAKHTKLVKKLSNFQTVIPIFQNRTEQMYKLFFHASNFQADQVQCRTRFNYCGEKLPLLLFRVIVLGKLKYVF